MSVANGFKDVMIEKQEDGSYKAFGLSPAGHKWCDTHLAYAGRIGGDPLVVGAVVNIAVMTLSVEIR